MRSLIIVGIGAAALAFAPLQSNVVKAHASKLEAAGSLKLVLSANISNAGTQEITLTLSKPNMMKLETPSKIKICDGKTITEYDKATKVYSETPWAENSLGLGKDLATWTWSAFFDKNFMDNVVSAEAGMARKVKGVAVKEVKVTLKDKNVITLMIDDATGLARGAYFTAKQGNADVTTILTASEITVGSALEASTFAFMAPEGAKKFDPATVPVLTYKDVAPIFNGNCMPCHNSQNRKNGIDVSSYDALMMGIQAGSPDNSRILRPIRRGKMPPAKPLSSADQDKIAKWITDGAKE